MTPLEFTIPPWLEADTPENAGDLQIKNGITRILINTTKEEIHSKMQMVLTWDNLDIASPTYLFVIYDMLKTNQPNFVDITDVERQFGLSSFLISRLFPTPSKLSDVNQSEKCKQEGTDKSENKDIRSPRGPPHENAVGFGTYPGSENRNLADNQLHNRRPYVIPARPSATEVCVPQAVHQSILTEPPECRIIRKIQPRMPSMVVHRLPFIDLA